MRSISNLGGASARGRWELSSQKVTAHVSCHWDERNVLAIEPSCSFFVCFAPHIFESNVAGIPCGPLVVPNSGHKDGHNKNNKTFVCAL